MDEFLNVTTPESLFIKLLDYYNALLKNISYEYLPLTTDDIKHSVITITSNDIYCCNYYDVRLFYIKSTNLIWAEWHYKTSSMHLDKEDINPSLVTDNDDWIELYKIKPPPFEVIWCKNSKGHVYLGYLHPMECNIYRINTITPKLCFDTKYRIYHVMQWQLLKIPT